MQRDFWDTFYICKLPYWNEIKLCVCVCVNFFIEMNVNKLNNFKLIFIHFFIKSFSIFCNGVMTVFTFFLYRHDCSKELNRSRIFTGKNEIKPIFVRTIVWNSTFFSKNSSSLSSLRKYKWCCISFIKKYCFVIIWDLRSWNLLWREVWTIFNYDN